MIDYTQFNEIEKEKEKEYKYFSLGDNEAAIFTFVSLKAGVRQNPWSGDQEDVWFCKLEDSDGNEKSWTISGLVVYRQLKEQNVQEGDLVRITKEVKGNRKKYIIEKIKPLGGKSPSEVSDEEIPIVEEPPKKDEPNREREL